MLFPIQLGPILLQEQSLLFFLSLALSYTAIVLSARGSKLLTLAKDTFWSIVLYGFFVWKLSYILFHPTAIWLNPIAVLYLNGGFLGLCLAFVLAIWLISRTPAALLPIWLLAFSVFLASYKLLSLLLLQFSFIQVGMLLIAASCSYVLWKAETVERAKRSALVGAMLLFFCTLFFAEPFFLGLSQEQWLYLACSATLLLTKQEKDEQH